MNYPVKSVFVMFIFDLAVLLTSTACWCKYFSLPKNIFIISLLFIVLTGTITLYLKSNYKIREFNNTKKNFYLLFEGVILMHIPLILFSLIFYRDTSLWSFIGANILTVFLLLKAYRFCFHYYLFYIKKEKNILIVGANANAKLIADEIINKKALRMDVAGFVKEPNGDNALCNDNKIDIYSINDDLRKIIIDKMIHIIIVAVPEQMEEKFLTAIVNATPPHVKIFSMEEFYEIITGKYFIDKMSINNLFFHFMKNRSAIYNFCKRAFDIIAALIILTVTFPILLYIAIRVKLTDGGSPIYTQNRVGKGGKVFKCYKLRTMYLNDFKPTSGNLEKAEANNQDTDSRVMPFCKFVRKARFDEIPQMINILKGDMSIVGPRAEWDDLVKVYKNEVPCHACRHWIKTGWTGWAQINQGHCIKSDDISEKLQYDLYYLKHRNVLWEIGILVKAVFLALGGRHG